MQSRVGLLRRTKIVFHSQVDLDASTREPATPRLANSGGFAISVIPSVSTKKAACLFFLATGHRGLNVINPKKREIRHASIIRRRCQRDGGPG